MKPLTFNTPLTITAAAGGKPRRFSILAYTGGILPVDGFDLPVVVDLQGLTIAGNVPILIDHTKSVENTLGITESITNDGKTLTMTGNVTGVSPTVEMVLSASDRGQQWQASIGAYTTETEEIPAGETVAVNGQVIPGPVIVARRAVLRETSVLPMGADSGTRVNLAARAALKGSAKMTMEEWVKSLGLDIASLSPEALSVLQKGYEMATAPTPAAATAATPEAAAVAAVPAVAAGAAVDLQAAMTTLRQQQAAEIRRIGEINVVAAGHPAIAATAIEQGWSRDKVELEVLKASAARTRPTSFRAAEQSPEEMGKVLEAAVGMTRRHKDVEKCHDAKHLQAAHTMFKRGIGLQQLFLEAAAANGRPVRAGERISNGNLRDVMAYACGGNFLQAGFSTVSLPGILSNIANKELLDGYMEEDDAWTQISTTKSVSDFKAVTSYRMLDDMEYEELGPAGEIKHGTTGQESYTRQAKTYAKMYAVTRTDIINDHLGAFDDLRNRVGRGAAKKLNKVFWTAFVNNSSFFTSARTNYISGSTSNLATDGVGLGLGVTAFRKMTSPSADGSKRVNGNGGRPTLLLVPPELEAAAETLYRNTNLGAVSGATANIYANKYRPVVAWQLSDSGYTGYSATAWYLLNDPSYLSTICVSFLNGQQTPTVESADADFNTLGIQFRGYHDFGVDMAEYLGGLKSKGAA